ncbi:2-amino-4-hydroxy-6-hydroxymethyldihydropteridine diphosphokinase [Sphingobacterium sp. SRCM116780]|uniref:2-amino-4-hydroxy-6- hydroxymethyldihydropteridine diphosphokinase n=1 Tax=Sphingobacterium sp. SRCM116780 TaxID=2907623 RepID=UPI001F441FB3|nr:2-amino-4-hydroxy-6-hydroxymethyldihydropteridine diphosphokinase [Sphingobacterium sp. SRCM116780]UIR56637.1 2-amino-4-hydroxy-6-hydroxymethyldihydropteridine diphosphokinase [Sphingobacterium sp. SRCM116780]
MKSSYILLGANLGHRILQLNQAQELIENLIGKVTNASTIVETAAWGREDQPSFLNQVIEIETSLSPIEVFEVCQTIENKLGRIRHEKWGARVIDIDILYYGTEIIHLPTLQIPHPYLQDRKFTLIPLAEIAPGYIHPILKKSNEELLALCQDTLDVHIYK